MASASAANESHATSSAADEENWRYVECAKCREEAVVQDKDDPTIHVLRPDFHLIACGHIACSKCLQAAAGQGVGSEQTCPRCQLNHQDTIPLTSAQVDPNVGVDFRSVEAMLGELSSTIKFQTGNLRDQVTYYKDIAKKQSAILKGTKQELIELRALKKNYEALQRENAALKSQLASAASTSTVRTQTRQDFHHSNFENKDQYVQQQPPMPLQNYLNSHPPDHAQEQDHSTRVQHASRDTSRISRPPSRTALPPQAVITQNHPRPSQGTKRSAAEAGLTFPPRMKESDLPGFAMSSAHVAERREEDPPDDGATQADTTEFLNSFRFQGGQGSTSAAKSYIRQTGGQSPHAPRSGSRRSSSSRGDLPAIEEAPFQNHAVQGDAAQTRQYERTQDGRSYRRDDTLHRHAHNNHDATLQHNYDTGTAFLKASEIQPQQGYEAPFEQEHNHGRTFRPLIARQGHHASDSSEHGPGQSRPVSLQAPIPQRPSGLQTPSLQRQFNPRPATAQGGSREQHPQWRPSQQVARPASAQAGRTIGGAGRGLIRPMAVPASASRPPNNTSRRGGFQFHPD